MKRDALVFIKHILDSIKRIESFIKNVSEKSFIGNEEKQSAVIRQLEIIGEAAKNVPELFRKKHQEIPWNDIAKTRDKIIHYYFRVDLDIIWDIIKNNLPELKRDIKEILEKEK